MSIPYSTYMHMTMQRSAGEKMLQKQFIPGRLDLCTNHVGVIAVGQMMNFLTPLLAFYIAGWPDVRLCRYKPEPNGPSSQLTISLRPWVLATYSSTRTIYQPRSPAFSALLSMREPLGDHPSSLHNG